MNAKKLVTITIILFLLTLCGGLRASDTNLFVSNAVGPNTSTTNTVCSFNQPIKLMSDLKPSINNRFFKLVDVFMPEIDSEVVSYKRDFRNLQYEGGSLGSVRYTYLMRDPRTRDTLSYSWRVGRTTLIQTSFDFITPSINGVYQISGCIRSSPRGW